MSRRPEPVGKEGAVSMCLGCACMIDQAPTGRWKNYCSSACRQAAYRERVDYKKRHPDAKGWWE